MAELGRVPGERGKALEESRREKSKGEERRLQLWFWSRSLHPLAAPSLHLLSGSSRDTRLGQAPGTRESGPGYGGSEGGTREGGKEGYHKRKEEKQS